MGIIQHLESLIFEIKKKISDLPIRIEIEGKKVKMSSTKESMDKGRKSWVWLSSYLSYILGYNAEVSEICLLYTSPSPRDNTTSRMPSSA